MSEPILALEDVAFGFDPARPVLEHLTLSVARGELVALVGPSGVGKSTLLRVVAGLVPPLAGRIALRSAEAPGRRPTALVFQDARLVPWRRVQANVELGLERLGLPRAEIRRRAEAALALVGLADRAASWPHQLSGGQRQRVGIARALAVQPGLLLVDEPFGALDAITRDALQDELLRIWAETAATILFVTHDLAEAAYLADRVVLLAGQPARVTRILDITEPRPRTRGTQTAAITQLRHALDEAYIGGSGI